MNRFASNILAAFVAVVITIASLGAVTQLPASQQSDAASSILLA